MWCWNIINYNFVFKAVNFQRVLVSQPYIRLAFRIGLYMGKNGGTFTYSASRNTNDKHFQVEKKKK